MDIGAKCSILAGGKSSRMGTDKAFMKLGDLTVMEFMIDKMSDVFDEIQIIADDTQKFRYFNVDLHEDIFQNFGPLGGIHSALLNSEEENNFIISVDLPLIPVELPEYLYTQLGKEPVVVPTDNGKLQPLCGYYSKKYLPFLEGCLIRASKKDSPSVLRFLEYVGYSKVEVSEMSFYQPEIFMNMNTPEDYDKIKQYLEV